MCREQDGIACRRRVAGRKKGADDGVGEADMIVVVRRAGLIMYILASLTFGTYCLVRPEKLRDYAIKNTSRGFIGKIRPLVEFVRSDAYLWNVRLFGVVLYLMAIGLVVALYDAAHNAP
jgi:hypothetical protein